MRPAPSRPYHRCACRILRESHSGIVFTTIEEATGIPLAEFQLRSGRSKRKAFCPWPQQDYRLMHMSQPQCSCGSRLVHPQMIDVISIIDHDAIGLRDPLWRLIGIEADAGQFGAIPEMEPRHRIQRATLAILGLQEVATCIPPQLL